MLETKFGPTAQDGDFVLVVDFDYMRRKCQTYAGRVYKDTIYTGMKKAPYDTKYIHKRKAEVVIPVSYVDLEVRRKIYEDMAVHNRDTIEYDAEKGILYERDR